MAQICDICGKKPLYGNNISHAHNVTRRRWNVNLQVVKALVNGAPKRLRVCASCIKGGKSPKRSAPRFQPLWHCKTPSHEDGVLFCAKSQSSRAGCGLGLLFCRAKVSEAELMQ